MNDSTKKQKHLDKLRKAAILIDSLDGRMADTLLDQMDSQYAARVRHAVMDLGQVGTEEQELVIAEFMRGGGAAVTASDSGIELDEALASKLVGADTDSPQIKDATPFRFLQEASCDSLAAFLQNEHPQTIAVVVSHLPSDRAAGVLTCLSDDLQSDVISRVAQLDKTDPEIIHEIERELQSLLSEELQTIERRSAGVATVKAILSAAKKANRDSILANLARHDRQLADQIRDQRNPVALQTTSVSSLFPVCAEQKCSPQLATVDTTGSQPQGLDLLDPTQLAEEPTVPNLPPVSPSATSTSLALRFEDLFRFDDRSLAIVLRAADPSLTILALTGARQEFVDRILSQLPWREAKTLRSRLEQTGPLRLSDVDQAQVYVTQLAGQLAAEGKIQIPFSRQKFAVAA